MTAPAANRHTTGGSVATAQAHVFKKSPESRFRARRGSQDGDPITNVQPSAIVNREVVP
jgi:hypothetical protein